MNTSTKGSISELKAAAALMEIGWHVYAALDSGAPFDLVGVTPDGRVLRLEVKTGSRDRTSWPTHHPERFDLLIVVFPDGVEYVDPHHPPSPHWGRIEDL